MQPKITSEVVIRKIFNSEFFKEQDASVSKRNGASTSPKPSSFLPMPSASCLSCGGGGGSRPPCSWQTCQPEWRNDWGPGISQGRCVNQRRNAHHIYSSHSGSGSCPSPSSCSHQTQYRTMCSCTNAFSCPFHGWSGWSGSVSQGTCRKQSRYRDYNQQTRYDIREGNCNGISSSCGRKAVQLQRLVFVQVRVMPPLGGEFRGLTSHPRLVVNAPLNSVPEAMH
ncbi:hypothetical protein OS493_008210 [Desmophyllum pertusum]|uniref:Uncharacterized protein n=1 Tax=Desmophyllum pertusum TaxID=174260 RepID=A0A9X0DAW3_9CNID|nr:hypothetical protein OS493_008210 [Desmophyllum pertusum]